MKNTIITIVFTMVVMIGIGFVLFSSVTKTHNEEMKIMKIDYEKKISDLNEKNTEKDSKIKNYENQIFNIVEGKNYDVTINHDNESINYSKKNDESLIGNFLGSSEKSKTVIR